MNYYECHEITPAIPCPEWWALSIPALVRESLTFGTTTFRHHSSCSVCMSEGVSVSIAHYLTQLLLSVSVSFNSPIGSSLPTLTSVHPISLTGALDHIPEVAFYMVGDIDDVLAAADKLAQ